MKAVDNSPTTRPALLLIAAEIRDDLPSGNRADAEIRPPGPIETRELQLRDSSLSDASGSYRSKQEVSFPDQPGDNGRVRVDDDLPQRVLAVYGDLSIHGDVVEQLQHRVEALGVDPVLWLLKTDEPRLAGILLDHCECYEAHRAIGERACG